MHRILSGDLPSILAEPWRSSCSQCPRLCSLNCSQKHPLDMGASFPLYFKLSNLIAYQQTKNLCSILCEVLTSMQPADVESSGGESEIPMNVLVLNHPA